MFGNGHVEVYKFHVVSLDTLTKATKIFAFIHHSWRINSHVVLSKVIELKELGKV